MPLATANALERRPGSRGRRCGSGEIENASSHSILHGCLHSQSRLTCARSARLECDAGESKS